MGAGGSVYGTAGGSSRTGAAAGSVLARGAEPRELLRDSIYSILLIK